MVDNSARSPVRFCTVIARNYLPQARVLARSLQQHHPEFSPLLVLCVDESPEIQLTDAPLNCIGPGQLDMPPETFWRMATLYDTTELCTALKPALLEFVLAQGAQVTVYLDPDMLVTRRMDGMLDDARRSVALLTPHRLTPLADDNLQPSEQSLLLSGHFNLGFIAVTPRAASFLDWWKERLETKSLIDHAAGYFTDQRWIDQAVHLFGLSVTRDPRLNIAYWNFDERLAQLRLAGTASAESPSLFHFSGYSPATPWLVSRHVPDYPRVRLTDESSLLEVFDQYASLLRDEGWQREESHELWPLLPDGTQRAVEFRTAYRSALRLSAIRRTNLPPPAIGDFYDDFASWATGCDSGHELPRWVEAVWHARWDLQAFAPDPEFADKRALMEWARGQGVLEGWVPHRVSKQLDRVQVADIGTSRIYSREVSSVAGQPVVCLVGYLDSVLGVGELGRSIARGLRCADIPFVTETWTASSSPRLDGEAPKDSASLDSSVDIIVINADQMQRWADVARPDMSLGYRIGVWSWELSEFPADMAQAEKWVDEVWTTSRFSAEAIRSAISKPVYVIPLNLADAKGGDSESQTATQASGRQFREVWPNGYFAFAFDLHSDIKRKNPIGLMQAHRLAFADEASAPPLVVKVLNASTTPQAAQQLRYYARKFGAILIEETWPRSSVDDFIGQCTAYVSLHRAEGFGFSLAEAMELGRPVIATGFSGNLDFMSEENSCLIPFRLTSVGSDSIYPSGGAWAEPDLGAAADALKSVAAGGEVWSARATRGQRDIRHRYSPHATSAFLTERLQHVASLASAREPDHSVPTQPKGLKRFAGGGFLRRRKVDTPRIGDAYERA